MSGLLSRAFNLGAAEAGIFLSSCLVYKLWLNKRTNTGSTDTLHLIEHEKYHLRMVDPEDSTRNYNVYPDEKVVIRFLH